MSQRNSGYKRMERDTYETPAWVVGTLMPHLSNRLHLWEPAAGAGKMVRALVAAGHTVNVSDIESGTDFLEVSAAPHGVHGIVTNPPFDQAQAFIEHAIGLMEPVHGFAAMLLRTDYDHAKGRQHLFGGCPIFSCKVVLTSRIRWFEDTKGHPSFNHAWFVWDWHHRGPPELRYPDSGIRLSVADFATPDATPGFCHATPTPPRQGGGVWQGSAAPCRTFATPETR